MNEWIAFWTIDGTASKVIDEDRVSQDRLSWREPDFRASIMLDTDRLMVVRLNDQSLLVFLHKSLLDPS